MIVCRMQCDKEVMLLDYRQCVLNKQAQCCVSVLLLVRACCKSIKLKTKFCSFALFCITMSNLPVTVRDRAIFELL